MKYKYLSLAVIFFITLTIQLYSGTTDVQENEKKDKSKTNGEMIFDSCGKKDKKKCDKDTKAPVADYSKYLK